MRSAAPPPPAAAAGFTAGSVMKEMDGGERYTYVTGIVEGIAHARYIRDGKQTAGRECIYDWFYKDETTRRKIFEAFERYPASLPGQVVGALAAVKCGT